MQSKKTNYKGKFFLKKKETLIYEAIPVCTFDNLLVLLNTLLVIT